MIFSMSMPCACIDTGACWDPVLPCPHARALRQPYLAQGADGAAQVQVTAFQSVRKEAPGNAMSRGGSAEAADSPLAKALAASKAGAAPLAG